MGHEGQGLLSPVAGQQGDDRPSAELRRFVAGERKRAGVGEDHAAIKVEKKDGIDEVLGDQPVALFGLAQRLRQMLTLARLGELGEQMLHLEGLREVREGCALYRLERGGQRGIGREEDHFGLGRDGLDALEDLEPGDIGELDVHDCRVEAPGGDSLEDGAPAGGGLDCIALQPDRVANRLASPGVVVDNQDGSRAVHPSRI